MKIGGLKCLLLALCILCSLTGCANTKARDITMVEVETEKELTEKTKEEVEELEIEEAVKAKVDSQNKIESEEDVDSMNERGTYKVALNGVMFRIPRTYYVSMFDEEAIRIMGEDYNFDILLAVNDDSYTEALKDMDGLTEKVRELDTTIIKDIQECEINGKSYAYSTFKYKDGDESITNAVAYTGAAGDKRIRLSIAIYTEMEVEVILEHIDEFLHNTEVTDAPDVTEEDLQKMSFFTEGISVEYAEFDIKEGKYRIKVPENFFLGDTYAYKDMRSTIYFESEYVTIDAETNVYAKEYGFDINQFLNEAFQYENESEYSNVKVSEIKEEKVNGNTVLYMNVSFDYGNCHFEQFFAGCRLPDGGTYTLEATSLYDEELTWELFKDFMDVEKVD